MDKVAARQLVDPLGHSFERRLPAQAVREVDDAGRYDDGQRDTGDDDDDERCGNHRAASALKR
jgi:hypothetical protein